MAGRVFLTGGTGFLGSNILYELLRLGYEVICLVRESKGISLRERLEIPLKVIDPNFDWNQYSDKIIIMAGDICLPKLGLSAEDLNWLKTNKPQSIFHCAGSTSFSKENSEKTWQINVDGTRNVIAFAHNVGIDRFHHISTAYVAGASKGTSTGVIGTYPANHFNNPYEHTKYHAEIIVVESGLNYTIYRPSIIIGAENGRTSSFAGYYRYQRTFWILKELILNRLKRDAHFYNGGGIKFEAGKLNLPINIKSSFEANLNLVPIDWVAKMVVALSEKELSSKRVFYLTHSNSPLIKWVILTSLNIMGITGVKLINPDEPTSHENEKLNDLQKMINKGLVDYEAYTNQDHRFDNYQTVILLNSFYQPPPPIDRAFLERTLNYAIEHKFKR